MENKLEEALYARGFSFIAGTDEAGRGPLAGDVFAAAVILPRQFDLPGLNDSKKLTEKRREKLFYLIQEQAVAFSIARASVSEIEELNILHASLLAMRRAVETLQTRDGKPISPDYVLVDGNQFPQVSCRVEAIPKGDGLSPSIAAASVLAKVARDNYMRELAQKYPQYGFERHKGYPTKAHYEAVDQYGLCEMHRISFFKKHKPLAEKIS
jgi:ribonuclease HII